MNVIWKLTLYLWWHDFNIAAVASGLLSKYISVETGDFPVLVKADTRHIVLYGVRKGRCAGLGGGQVKLKVDRISKVCRSRAAAA